MSVTERAKQDRRIPASAMYSEDFVRWCFEQADLLKARHFSKADLKNIVEELESMGNEQRRALRSSYRLLIMHLLKWQHQPQRRSRSWRNTITRERVNIADYEGDSATLRDQALVLVAEAYPGAVRRASDQTDLARRTFPAECPYTLEQLRDPDWMPE